MALIDPTLIRLHRPKYRVPEEEMQYRIRLLSRGQVQPLLVKQIFPEDTTGYYYQCADELQSANLLALRHLKRRLVKIKTDWIPTDL